MLRSQARRAGLRRILGLARPEARALVFGTLCLVFSSGSTLAYPAAIRWLIDETLGSGSAAAIDRATVMLMGLFFVQAVSAGLRSYFFTAAGERIVARLRSDLFARLLDQEIGFFDQNRTGELMSRLSNDTQILQNTVSVNISMLLRNLASAVGAIILLFFLSVKLTLVMLSVVPLLAVGAVVFGWRVRTQSKNAQDALAGAGEIAEESLAGIRTVRAFAQEDAERGRYGKAIERSLRSAIARTRSIALFAGGTSLSGGFAIAAVLWSGGRMVAASELTTGGVTAFLLYSVIVAFCLGALTDLWSDFMKASGAAERVFALMDRAPAVPPRGGTQLDGVQGRVSLEGVRFAYPSRPDVEVLGGVDLELAPGERVALVGPSGSGKSTVANLVLRFYDPEEGTVRLDGRDLRELDPQALRQQIAVVSQEPVLISASVAENIRYGRRDASPDEVRAAARAANAEAFVDAFPEGFDTEVGERGVQLSGGQKQRVAIARALIRDPRVLILDEATSALDAESEHLVKQALDRLMEGRTTLIIAHRLSTVRDADRVAVLESGKLAQVGSHRQLMEDTSGLYRKLVERQFEPEPALVG
ncbi:MAG: ABC transporter transmembrane domain-containing protein [Myxococcota bacterium]